ncbi:DUF4041 domain-containing protein [Anaerococcus sp. AGMB09787]|uniref:DUF4041 domain-containing protein n=1 Tax=Anaerococcus sp. AGMB09787 TaxID=2922869 RepID=UPI001FAFA738|nr:DUF4041 domain-containing protein [Anaerococcus sp. AGMB09787]
MGVFDFLNAKKYKKDAEELQKEIESIKEELKDVDKKTSIELKQHILEKEKEIEELDKKIELKNLELKNKDEDIEKIKKVIKEKSKEILSIDETIELQTYGIYTPRYNLVSSEEYKKRLDKLRDAQKKQIKDKTAVNFFDKRTVDGSKAKGRKMTNDNIKQILRSFNNECEAAINKVKVSNIETVEKRIRNSFTQLNKLNESNRVSIKTQYLNLKIEELYLSFEYEKKKAEEKEILREQREKEKEEKKLQKEIQDKKKIIDKDIKHYKNMIDELNEKLKSMEGELERKDINNQILDLNTKVQEKEEEKEEMDYRSANATAGYVYIISNVGSFGDDVVKIGVTRRLDPYERIAELSSASVPFRFDIHALIFSYQAYELETALHNKFNNRRVNAINHRKEFFKIPIEEIKEALNEYKDLTIDFTEVPDAEEYRQTLKLYEKN